MSGSQSALVGGGTKPRLITVLTSGTGTYVPTVDMARCFVRVQGGGGAGGGSNSSGASAGSAGAMVEEMFRVPIAGFTYAVGAGGVGGNGASASTDGSQSRFGILIADKGLRGINASNSGGAPTVGTVGGGGGGKWNTGAPGAAGWAAVIPPSAAQFVGTSLAGTGNESGAGGGDSFYGSGGNGGNGGGTGANGNAPAAGAYGAGGGGAGGGSGNHTGGNGLAGCIEIWDYGA